jgi:ubiquinone/menaquinone biosynthesis C-methylase UbiE
MPFADRVFDRAYMPHVGMNIRDKEKLCSEVSRVSDELAFRNL